MATPNTHRTALLPRRVQKRPRVLNYMKCQFCRDPKVKTKCVWDEGSWPSKCRRCRERGLACSKPRHKAEERFANLQESTMSPATIPNGGKTVIHHPSALLRPSHPKPSSSGVHAPVGTVIDHHQGNHQFAHLSSEDREQILLQLLPFHAMVLMAWEERKTIVQELVARMSHDNEESGPEDALSSEEALSSTPRDPMGIAKFVKDTIEDLAPYGQLGMRAALDLSHYSCIYKSVSEADDRSKTEFFDEVEERKNFYTALGHSGMAVVLSIYQFLGLVCNFDPDPDPITDFTTSGDYHTWHNSFRNSCNQFSLDIQESMDQVEVPDHFPALRGRLLFIPTRLINSPRIRVFWRNKKVKDILRRSVALLEYDAGLSLTAFDLTEDVPDSMRRTILHAACIRNDLTTINLFKEKGLIHHASMRGDISPLHIVASTGNTYIFFLLCREYEKNDCLGDALMAVDYDGNTVLGCAAAHGHHELIDSYLSTHKFKSDKNGFLDHTSRILHPTYTVVSAFRRALSSGERVLSLEWYQTVKVMAKYLSSPTFWDNDHRTPLWYGCYYGRASVIPSLLKVGSTHVPDNYGRTPLMQASERGSVEIVNLLLHPNFGETAQMAPPDLPDARARDQWGKTAKDLAEKNGHKECAKILSDWMGISN